MLTVEELERLVTSFSAAAAVVDDLVKNTNQIIETNKKLNSMIDTKAYLDYTQGDLIKNLKEQNIITKSFIYLFLSDEDTLRDIIKISQKNNDIEVFNFWTKRLTNEQQ